jgi:threonine aldolase
MVDGVRAVVAPRQVRTTNTMHIYDFRSDTVTLPTAEMMAAIATAKLGDSGRGDDPTVNELERLSREITGKEDALFVPSGAMANLAAVMAHGCHGGEVIVEESAHIYNSEGGALSVVAGAIARPVRGSYGVMDPGEVRAAIRGDSDLAIAPTKLICVENTHNASGGSVVPLETMAALRVVAQQAGLPVHLDGARLFNAATYLNVPILEICKHVDSVWFALCKGLGGPVGAILAGESGFMRRARRAAKMLGGGMRQAGLIAAPALVALKDPYAVHRRDHALAQDLARGLAAIDDSLVAVDRVQTNIVNCFVDRFATDAGDINRALRDRGILANAKRTKIRFVTHYHIDEAAIAAAIQNFAEVIKPFRKVA